MSDFLKSGIFVYFLVPLVTVFFNVFVKAMSRNDRWGRFKMEDIAVGLNISTTALIIFLSYCSTLANNLPVLIDNQTSLLLSEKITIFPWVIVGFLIGSWGVSSIVRKFGWRVTNDEVNQRVELKLWIGVIFPMVYGISNLYVVLLIIR